MRPEYVIDLEHGCIFIKWSGGLKAHDILTFNRELVQDPDYRFGLNRLEDMRRAKIEAPGRDIRAIIGEVIGSREASEGHRKAAMLVGRKIEWGLMRMVGMLASETRSVVRPFLRLDEAMAWLGLPETLGDPFEMMNLS